MRKLEILIQSSEDSSFLENKKLDDKINCKIYNRIY